MAYYLRNAANSLRTFDQAFEPRQSGDPVSSVGTPYNNSSGQDIINDYVPLSFGGSQIDADSHYHADNNADLRQIFAAAGTVARWQTPFYDNEGYLDRQVAPKTSRIIVRVRGDGEVVFLGDESGSPSVGVVIPSTVSPADVEFRCNLVSGTGPQSNNMLNWTDLSGSNANIDGELVYVTNNPTPSNGDFRLEFRQKSNTSLGNEGTFTLIVGAG